MVRRRDKPFSTVMPTDQRREKPFSTGMPTDQTRENSFSTATDLAPHRENSFSTAMLLAPQRENPFSSATVWRQRRHDRNRFAMHFCRFRRTLSLDQPLCESDLSQKSTFPAPSLRLPLFRIRKF